MRLAVVTDLDGTLLDHDTYSYAAAAPALAALRSAGVPLILASSKTAAEIAALHAELDLGTAPAIVENGAGFYRPGASAQTSEDYAKLRAALAAIPEAAHFQGFADMGPAKVAEVTGLPPAAAALSCDRHYSEPGLWHGPDDALARFTDALAAQGIHARRGGRFLTLSYGRTKADAVAELRKELQADTIVALGDAPNDAEMLKTADIGVLIRNDHAPEIPDLTAAHIRRTELAGPSGWNRAILEILEQND